MALKIYLIRHGQTAWSVSGQHTGWTDIPLTPQGEDEARQCGARLAGISFDHVFVSPLQRARRTCELVALKPTPQVDERLKEWKYGDYDGVVLAEIHNQNPGWNVFLHGAPNGESPAQVAARADSFIADVQKLDGNVAIFAHGHFLRSFTCRWQGLDIAEGRNLALGTSAICVLGREASGPKLILWNSLSQLPR